MNKTVLIATMALVIVGSLALVSAQTGNTPRQTIPELPQDMGMISQMEITNIEANSTLAIQFDNPEPKQERVLFKMASGVSITCGNGDMYSISILHGEEVTPYTDSGNEYIWYSDHDIIEHGEFYGSGIGMEFFIFSMNMTGDQVVATGMTIGHSSQQCMDRMLPITVIMDCNVGMTYDNNGTATKRQGSYVMTGLSDNGFVLNSTSPNFESYCH